MFKKTYVLAIYILAAAFAIRWTIVGHLYRTELQPTYCDSRLAIQCNPSPRKMSVDILDEHRLLALTIVCFVLSLGLIIYLFLNHGHSRKSQTPKNF